MSTANIVYRYFG